MRKSYVNKVRKRPRKYVVCDRFHSGLILEHSNIFSGQNLTQHIKVCTNHKNLIQDDLGLDSNWVMRWSFLLGEYTSEIMHITGIANTVADAISWFDMDPTCKISEDILKTQDGNDYIHGKLMHFTSILSQSLLDNNNLVTNVWKCFTNNSKTV